MRSWKCLRISIFSFGNFQNLQSETWTSILALPRGQYKELSFKNIIEDDDTEKQAGLLFQTFEPFKRPITCPADCWGFYLSQNVEVQQTIFWNNIGLLKKLNAFPNRILCSRPDSYSILVPCGYSVAPTYVPLVHPDSCFKLRNQNRLLACFWIYNWQLCIMS